MTPMRWIPWRPDSSLTHDADTDHLPSRRETANTGTSKNSNIDLDIGFNHRTCGRDGVEAVLRARGRDGL
jgi:hypothetical protein